MYLCGKRSWADYSHRLLGKIVPNMDKQLGIEMQSVVNGNTKEDSPAPDEVREIVFL
jgi:hypothetical protein